MKTAFIPWQEDFGTIVIVVPDTTTYVGQVFKYFDREMLYEIIKNSTINIISLNF